MNKYRKLKEELEETGSAKMHVVGQSMKPLIFSHSMLTYSVRPEYRVGDIVFSRVKGRYIDAHKILSKDEKKGYLIGNNHGLENGWTHEIFAKVVKAENEEHGINEFE